MQWQGGGEEGNVSFPWWTVIHFAKAFIHTSGAIGSFFPGGAEHWTHGRLDCVISRKRVSLDVVRLRDWTGLEQYFVKLWDFPWETLAFTHKPWGSKNSFLFSLRQNRLAYMCCQFWDGAYWTYRRWPGGGKAPDGSFTWRWILAELCLGQHVNILHHLKIFQLVVPFLLWACSRRQCQRAPESLWPGSTVVKPDTCLLPLQPVWWFGFFWQASA